MQIESEIKFSIQEGFYGAIESNLLNWKLIESFEITFVEDKKYTDIYFDTSTKTLFRSGLYLRLRYLEFPEIKRIAYRAYSAIGSKLIRFTEFDCELTNDVFVEILNNLERFVPKMDGQYVGKDPIVILSKRGILPCVNLNLQRMNFQVKQKSIAVGTVSLDRVIYQLDEMTIPYQEIEIKVPEKFLSVLEPLTNCLFGEFSQMIRLTTLTKIQRAFVNKDIFNN